MDIGSAWHPGLFAAARLTKRVQRLLPVLLVLLLVGCAGVLRWSPEYHDVRPGETLYSIALQYDLDPRQLAAWNNLGDGSMIVSGQRLRLSGPTATSGGSTASTRKEGSASANQGSSAAASGRPAEPVAAWRWPTAGSVVTTFGATPETESGIHIAGRLGQQVRAAAGGQVVYAGSGLVGYGQLVIIKHNANYLSAYGHNDSLRVKEGDRVTTDQTIARMGLGPSQRPMLHFEIRLDGRPVNPVRYLPPR